MVLISAPTMPAFSKRAYPVSRLSFSFTVYLSFHAAACIKTGHVTSFGHHWIQSMSDAPGQVLVAMKVFTRQLGSICEQGNMECR